MIKQILINAVIVTSIVIMFGVIIVSAIGTLYVLGTPAVIAEIIGGIISVFIMYVVMELIIDLI